MSGNAALWASPRKGLVRSKEREQKTARNTSPTFKAKVTPEAIRGDKTLAELPSSTTYRTRSPSGRAS
jgi:hypothetical protein